MRERWEKIAALYAAKPIRERILLGAMVLAAVYMVWEFAFSQPLAARQTALLTRYDAALEDQKNLSLQESVLTKALLTDPNAEKKRQISHLQLQVDKLDEQMKHLSVGLVPAGDLPVVVRDMIIANQRLTLLGLNTLAPQRIHLKTQALERESSKQTSAPKEQATDAIATAEKMLTTKIHEKPAPIRDIAIFKHAVEIRLAGSFFDVQAYLAQLERLPWKFYWSYLDYQVDHYPQGVVSLELYTLATEQGVIRE